MGIKMNDTRKKERLQGIEEKKKSNGGTNLLKKIDKTISSRKPLPLLKRIKRK